jgi:tol-pal system protein YbgF
LAPAAFARWGKGLTTEPGLARAAFLAFGPGGAYDLPMLAARSSLALIGLLAAALGCHRQDAADRSIEDLRAELTKVQADHDRLDERLGALESAEQRRAENEQRGLKGRDSGVDEGRSRLKVVRVGDAGELAEAGTGGAESAEPAPGEGADDQGSRPLVEATGSRVPTRRGKPGDVRAYGESTVLSPQAKHEYDAALALVRSKQYDKALDALAGFLVHNPDHPYAENAMYWRGECFYASGDYARAAEQFEGMNARFPYGNKAPDALLKLGMSQKRLGNEAQAQKTFGELRDRYPKSEAVRQIPKNP